MIGIEQADLTTEQASLDQQLQEAKAQFEAAAGRIRTIEGAQQMVNHLLAKIAMKKITAEAVAAGQVVPQADASNHDQEAGETGGEP